MLIANAMSAAGQQCSLPTDLTMLEMIKSVEKAVLLRMLAICSTTA